MKILRSIFIIGFWGVVLTACKKEIKPQVRLAITGKWYVRQYTLTNYVNGNLESSSTTPAGWFTDSDYFQLNTDGSGIESQANPAIGKTSFSFHVANSTMFLSRPLILLSEDTIAYSMPASNQLIWTDTYTQLSPTGNADRTIEEVDLSK